MRVPFKYPKGMWEEGAVWSQLPLRLQPDLMGTNHNRGDSGWTPGRATGTCLGCSRRIAGYGWGGLGDLAMYGQPFDSVIGISLFAVEIQPRRARVKLRDVLWVGRSGETLSNKLCASVLMFFGLA